MQSPLVDILVPTYEPHPGFLREAIESALQQTETRWRMIIHDDASSADVRRLIEPYLKDKRISFERSSKRLGIGGNWNACVSRIPDDDPAPFVAFLFQDDVWSPDYLATAVHLFETHESVGFVSLHHAYRGDDATDMSGYAELQRMRETRLQAGLHSGKEFLAYWLKHQLHPNFIGEPSFVVLRRNVLDSVGPFHESMPQFLDVEYWLRCLLVTDWYFEPNEHGMFRVHGGGASARNNASGTGMYDRLECFQMIIRRLKRNSLRSAAVAARNEALETMARKFFLRVACKQRVPAKGTGGILTFAMKHPFLIVKSLFKALSMYHKK